MPLLFENIYKPRIRNITHFNLFFMTFMTHHLFHLNATCAVMKCMRYETQGDWEMLLHNWRMIIAFSGIFALSMNKKSMVNRVPVLDWIFHSEVHSDDGAPSVPLTVVIKPNAAFSTSIRFFKQLRFFSSLEDLKKQNDHIHHAHSAGLFVSLVAGKIQTCHYWPCEY